MEGAPGASWDTENGSTWERMLHNSRKYWSNGILYKVSLSETEGLSF